MGTCIRSKMIVGLTYDNLSEIDSLDDMLDVGDLDYASPYYDADRIEWVVGVELDNSYSDIAKFNSDYTAARNKFFLLTQKEPKLICSPDVY